MRQLGAWICEQLFILSASESTAGAFAVRLIARASVLALARVEGVTPLEAVARLADTVADEERWRTELLPALERRDVHDRVALLNAITALDDLDEGD